MKIYNVIWVDYTNKNSKNPEYDVQSFKYFVQALRTVNRDILNYELHHGLRPEIYNLHDDYLYARMEGLFEVEILATEVK